MEHEVENLVVCSTLNQITNFLIIRTCKPKKIFNITFNDDTIKKFNINIKSNKWDDYLKKECKEFKVKASWKDINLSIEDIQNLKKLKEKLNAQIIKKSQGEIYWHVTGGQRTIALAISELIKDKSLKREEDRLIYIEGNTEELIVNDCDGKLLSETGSNYGKQDITFETTLNLTGFKTKDLEKSTVKFKQKGKLCLDTNEKFIEEHEFYQKLYKIIELDANRTIDKKCEIIKFKYDNEDYEGSFRNLLLGSNAIKNTKDTKDNTRERIKYVKELFKKVKEKYKDIQGNKYDILESHEIYGSYPAGYIFEKLTAHRIYDIVKNNSKVIEMKTSLKTYFEKYDNDDDKTKNGNIIDELDVVLLTDTGKVVNFECKSGGMKGDNAKSNKYTTYRLAGVFGMPILLSPLYRCEIQNKESLNDELKKQSQAVREAEAVELNVIAIDEISEEKIKRLLE
ncbi:hypothetical protein [Clostridium guangxiense]|uniref:hypothetical protein n=1 Tax=Clostridium guangxiense TaxID=1662055 RepID=UPI001E39BACD|nr:hypothetical protein [Clostridium guangxiense]MCD2348052.1 hypothetical protein [Clostridium guangxiense]